MGRITSDVRDMSVTDFTTVGHIAPFTQSLCGGTLVMCRLVYVPKFLFFYEDAV